MKMKIKTNKQIKLKLVFCIVVVFVVMFVIWKSLMFFYKKTTIRNTNDDAIFYCYFEKNELYKDNFKYFLQHVVEPLHKSVDIYIIINGECSVPLPNHPNVKIIKRKNEGYDFGAYSHCISHHVNKDYEYYIFINSSVRGPIPSSSDWIKKFKNLFKKDVGLVGVSINMVGREHLISISGGRETLNKKDIQTHVQSMFFILKKDVFMYLRDEKKFFSDENMLNKTTDMWDVIMQKEIGMSQYVLDAGWNLNCMLPKYQDHDYRVLTTNINTSCDDPYSDGCYFGDDIKPEEAIFHKVSRMALS